MLVVKIVETASWPVAQHAIGAQVSEEMSPRSVTLCPGRILTIVVMTEGGAACGAVLSNCRVVSGGLPEGLLLYRAQRGLLRHRSTGA